MAGIEHEIRYIPLRDLQEDPLNPKAHDETAIVDSIRRFSIIEPFVVDERTGYLISGHGRKKALLEICVSKAPCPNGVVVDPDGVWTVPVVVGWSSRTDAEARAALIALNRTTELGGWVDASLLSLLDDLSETTFTDVVGFTDEDRETLRRLVDAETFLEESWNGDLDALGEDVEREPSLAREALPAPPLAGEKNPTLGAYRTLVVRVADEAAYQRLVEFIGTPSRHGTGKNGTESYWYGDTLPEARSDSSQHAQTLFEEPTTAEQVADAADL